MKITFTGLVILMSSLGIARAEVIATCGKYQLVQEVKSHWFAGIEHSQNTYSLEDESSSRYMDMLPNSEGAILKGEDVFFKEDDSEDGVISTSTTFEITAMWNKFELTISEGQNVPPKIFSCTAVKQNLNH